MMALSIVAVGLAAALFIAALLNRPINVAANFTLGERSILIGNTLILTAYGVWAVLVSTLLPAPAPPATAFIALGVLNAAAWVGAKLAWWYLDRRDAALTAARTSQPQRWRQIGGRHDTP